MGTTACFRLVPVACPDRLCCKVLEMVLRVFIYAGCRFRDSLCSIAVNFLLSGAFSALHCYSSVDFSSFLSFRALCCVSRLLCVCRFLLMMRRSSSVQRSTMLLTLLILQVLLRVFQVALEFHDTLYIHTHASIYIQLADSIPSHTPCPEPSPVYPSRCRFYMQILSSNQPVY